MTIILIPDTNLAESKSKSQMDKITCDHGYISKLSTDTTQSSIKISVCEDKNNISLLPFLNISRITFPRF